VKIQRVLGWPLPASQPKIADKLVLIARIGSVSDLAECYAAHKASGVPYPETSLRILSEMWRILLSQGAMQLCLVTNHAKLGSQIISFSAVVFVTDEFCSEARSKFRPYLGVQLAKQYLERQLPALNREHVARGNAADGLNVMMCFEGRADDNLSSEQLLAVRSKQNEALHLALSGYRLKEFLANPIGANAAQWMLHAGARLRRDYSNYFRENHRANTESLRWPCLVGLTKEEAFARPGSNLSTLFNYAAPRFRFNHSQRVLLLHALTGETCEQAAASLSISPSTVKKRWHAIYDRVADIDAELLPPPVAYGSHSSSRGAERRRYLLNYLRQHLEEVRPFERCSRGGVNEYSPH
jgi:DNA-binding CsgD family transcriptional regulator